VYIYTIIKIHTIVNSIHSSLHFESKKNNILSLIQVFGWRVNYIISLLLFFFIVIRVLPIGNYLLRYRIFKSLKRVKNNANELSAFEFVTTFIRTNYMYIHTSEHFGYSNLSKTKSDSTEIS